MTQKIRILTSNVTNPWFNLATEDWIFRNLSPDVHTLFLWRNSETVVIGRYQNPWVECRTDIMERDGVYLARRQSGGGAVFHDLGNTNFTFLSPAKGYDQDANFKIIIDALATHGIHAEVSGRNDMTVDGRKISGSAFKQTAQRKFHHGTLLLHANMSKLTDYLNPHKLKLKAKGIQSVRARVANLIEFNDTLNHDIVCNSIIDSFCSYYGEQVEVEELDEVKLRSHTELTTYYNMMADWDWRFGKTPEFTHFLEERFDWGTVVFHLNVHNAHIDDVVIFSDALDTQLIAALNEGLKGITYQPDAIQSALETMWQAHNQCVEWQRPIENLQAWLAAEITI